MTRTSPMPEPRYVTMADLEAFEGRLINRLSDMELRLVREAEGRFRWTIGLIVPIYAVLIAAILSGGLAIFNLLGKLPTAVTS